MRHQGTVYWVTGLAGAGKTTISNRLYEEIKAVKPNVVLLDGDILRGIFARLDAHTLEDRKELAMQYCRLCKELAAQGIDVICATISLFRECHEWNRQSIEKYREIYLKVPMEVLIERDQKKLYSRALKGEVKNVWGIDLEVQEPANADMVINNDGSFTPHQVVEQIMESI